jgi:hypothetical protein
LTNGDEINSGLSDTSSRQIIYDAAKNNSWCLCIFFSVDMEGATAYKVETRIKRRSDNDWCSLFRSFYTEFPERFFSKYPSLINFQPDRRVLPAKCPVLWKFAGDEILFYATLTNSYQILDHLYAFHQTIIDYNEALKSQNVKVRCKGTAWIAGFPINNRIILLSDHTKSQIVNQSQPIIDFLGSSIDCGFRLTKFSSSRKLVVSLDLLWIAAKSFQCYRRDTRLAFMKTIRYAGEHVLKGVFSGQPYPIFWIDAFSEPPIEDEWIDIPSCCKCADIDRFCEQSSLRIGADDFIKPFIFNDATGLFGTVAAGFEEQRKGLTDYYEDALHEKTIDEKTIDEDSVQSSKVESEQTGVRKIKLRTL